MADTKATATVSIKNFLGRFGSAGIAYLATTIDFFALALPSVATWWCGEAPVRRHALERLSKLVIKGAFPSQHFAAVDGQRLHDRDRDLDDSR